MGGTNSGSWYRWNRKTTVEECRKIDIRHLKKIGRLYSGCSGTMSYNRGGESTGSISYQVSEGYIRVSFRIRETGGYWVDVNQNIRITESPCHYGGTRKWLECPSCNRRITTLYQGQKYFLCRHCYRLTYSSCSEHWIERITRKQDKVKMLLGGSPNDDWIPKKPKWMHKKTYDKHYNEFVYLDDRSEQAFQKMLVGRTNNS